jgi:glycosyltransferase involved in cell wall biosynthesis
MLPDVSIIIPAHNAGRTIEDALASVFAQTRRSFELIVVDDGSTDDTRERVRAADLPVCMVQQPHRGMVEAWNAGVRRARGQLLMLLDAGAIWMPRKIERQLRYFDAYPEAALLTTPAVTSASPAAAMLATADAVPLDVGGAAPHLHACTRGCPAFEPSTLAVRRDALDTIGLFDAGHDLAEAAREAGARIAARFPVGHLSTPTAVVRPRADRHDADRESGSSRNLLQDTAYRRARSRVTAAVHAMDDALAKRNGGPARILFEAASPMSLAVFGPVLRQMAADPRVAFWFTSCDTSWDTHQLFESAGIRDRVLTTEQVTWAKFDGYVNTDFWDMTWLRRRTRRVHFFHGVAGKYGLDAPVKIAPVVSTFDRLMFPNRDRLRRYAEAGLIDIDSPKAALIGYPKVDCLVDGSLDRNATAARLGLRTGRPTVLYAPTWSPYSSLNTMGGDVVAALGGLDVNVVVKLHDRSYDATARGSGGVDWRHRLQQICDEHGAHLVQDADASPYLHAADLLVTDHSSVGFEFMLLDRPIVVIDSPELIANARVNPDKVAMLRSAAFVVYARAELRRAVTRALLTPSEHHAERRCIADELFYCPGTATARAVRELYTLFELPLPAAIEDGAPDRALHTLAPLARGF